MAAIDGRQFIIRNTSDPSHFPFLVSYTSSKSQRLVGSASQLILRMAMDLSNGHEPKP